MDSPSSVAPRTRSTCWTAPVSVTSRSATGWSRRNDARVLHPAVAWSPRAVVVGGAGDAKGNPGLSLQLSGGDRPARRTPDLAPLLRIQRSIVSRRHGVGRAGDSRAALADVRRSL